MSFKVDNQFVTATVPYEYQDLTNFAQDDVLYLDSFKLNGLVSIFSIDNIPQIVFCENNQALDAF